MNVCGGKTSIIGYRVKGHDTVHYYLLGAVEQAQGDEVIEAIIDTAGVVSFKALETDTGTVGVHDERYDTLAMLLVA